MLIHCTQKLLKELKKEPATAVGQESPLFSWHANVITMQRKKAVVLVNDNNRYVIVLYGLRAKDFQKLDELIIRAIHQAFREEGIKDGVIDQYLHLAGSITFSKTKNRSTVARLNNSIEMVQTFEELLQNDHFYQTDLSMQTSRLLVLVGKDSYHPNEKMYQDLEATVKGPIFSGGAALLKITLELDEFEVWRKIIVPVHMTFNRLHKVIQVAFGWQDHHLHEYYILGNEKNLVNFSVNHPAHNKEGRQPIVNLVPDEESLAYEDDVPRKLEFGIKLSEYLPAKMKYIYDFGDYWVHRIEIEKEMDDFDKNYPVCLEVHGNTPPEDVGGEGGYEEFLNIIADKHHPEHEDLVSWGRMQGYEDVNIENINRSLQREECKRFRLRMEES